MFSIKLQGSLSTQDMEMLQACWLPEDCLEGAETRGSTLKMKTLRQKSTERPNPSQYHHTTVTLSQCLMYTDSLFS